MSCTGYHIPHNVVLPNGKPANFVCADCGAEIPSGLSAIAPGGAASVETIGDWTIWHQPWPIECRDYDWHFAHKNVRVAEELSGHAESRDMCLQQIDWLDEMERHRETEEGKAETAKFVDAGMRSLNRAMLARALTDAMPLLDRAESNASGFPDFESVHAIVEACRYAVAQYEEQTNG